MLAEKHDGQSHVGFWKTLRSIQTAYYWPNMHKTTYEYVTKCTVCRQIKSSNENTRTPTGEYQDPIYPGRVLSVDLVGPLPASKIHKHMWIITCVDAFSQYLFAKACVKATASVIADFLEKEVFYRFDTPHKMITDNGSQFTSDFFTKFLQSHNVIHQTTPVYHSQANMVEATNKCIKTMLKSQLLDKASHVDWSSYLHKVVMHINTTARTSTGQSPHYIHFGKEKAQTGNEHRLLNDATKDKVPETDRRELIYEESAEQSRAAFEQNKSRYNLRATQRTFNIGDMVYVTEQKKSNAGQKYAQKLAAKKKVGYIQEKVGTDTYLVVDNQRQTMGRFHAQQIFTR